MQVCLKSKRMLLFRQLTNVSSPKTWHDVQFYGATSHYLRPFSLLSLPPAR